MELIKNPRIRLENHLLIFNGMDISESTREDYQARIKNFIVFLQDRNINYDTYLDFKRHLEGNANLSVASKNKYLLVAKVYLKELYRKGMLPTDITTNVKQFKQTKGHKKFGHTEEDVKKLFYVLKYATYRDRAIFFTLFLQGLRQVELLRLEAQDIDFEHNTAFIQGKGNDDKEIIHLNPAVTQVLREYIELNAITGKVFNISDRQIRNIHSMLLKKAGISGKTLHGSRHFFVTQLLKSFEGNIIEVSKLTRHKTLEMLQTYNDEITSEKNIPKFIETFKNIL